METKELIQKEINDLEAALVKAQKEFLELGGSDHDNASYCNMEDKLVELKAKRDKL